MWREWRCRRRSLALNSVTARADSGHDSIFGPIRRTPDPCDSHSPRPASLVPHRQRAFPGAVITSLMPGVTKKPGPKQPTKQGNSPQPEPTPSTSSAPNRPISQSKVSPTSGGSIIDAKKTSGRKKLDKGKTPVRDKSVCCKRSCCPFLYLTPYRFQKQEKNAFILFVFLNRPQTWPRQLKYAI